LRLERDIAARHPRLHLEYFLALDVQRARDGVDLAGAERATVRVAIQGIRLHALFHRAQIEEQLALSLVVATFTMRQFFRMYS